MALVPTSELEAVNLMLATIGEAPVSTLEQSGQVDAVIARSVLSEIAVEVQSRGWHFNTDKAYPLFPSAASPYEIVLPEGAVQVDAADVDTYRRLAIRQGKLWDLENHTFSFEGVTKILVDIVWLFPFDECPQAARRFATMTAGRRFQANQVGSPTLHRFTEQDERDARAAMAKFEAKTAKRSMLTGSWTVARTLSRRTPQGA